MKKLILLVFVSTFFFNARSQYAKLFDFDYTPKGANPYGALYSEGTFLYGLAEQGGSNDDGAMFKIKPDGTGFVNLFNFNSSTTGAAPHASLISDGTFFYGTTSNGGANGKGTVFKIKPDGTGFVNLFNFGITNGAKPMCTLYYDGTYLYGTTTQGGVNNTGVLFKIKPDGTGFSVLLEFNGTLNGSIPSGALIFDGTSLYGTTRTGGANSNGTIYKIKKDGTGYVDLFDFAGISNGSNIYGSLISDGTFFYGMTQQGGTNDLGTIFKIKPDGTGHTLLLQFADTSNGANPQGSLYYDGTFLYGVTGTGGVNHFGTIFKIKPDGTGYSKLFEFSGTNGKFPYGSLISVGGVLYGLTEDGGIEGDGTLFKYDLGKSGIASENSKNDFKVYPNPTCGRIMIQYEGLAYMKYNLEIHNILGENIYSDSDFDPKNQTEIDLSNNSTGIYFLKIYSNRNVYSQKIILK